MAGGGITIVSFRITGISPLLMNNPGSMGRPVGGQGVNTKKIPTPEEEAAGKTYRLDNGDLCLPSIAFRASLLGGCTGLRLGKVGAATVIGGAVFNTTDRVALVDPATNKPLKTYEISTMRAVVNKAGVLRSRPMLPQWACDIDFEVDTEFLPDPKVVVELLNRAGRTRGVGDFRPQKRGPYGRFTAELVNNNVSTKKKSKAA